MASTIPVPAGVFIPLFKIGAALGRIVGELVHAAFPLGLRYGHHLSPILPGFLFLQFQFCHEHIFQF